MADMVREVVYVAPEEVDDLLAVAGEYSVDAELQETEALAPLVPIILIGVGAAVAGAINYWQDKGKGGQVIDLRENVDPWMYRTKNLQYGLVLVRAADGKVTVDVKEPKGFFLEVINSVVAAVQGVAEKGIEAVKKAAEAAVGDKGTVTAESGSGDAGGAEPETS